MYRSRDKTSCSAVMILTYVCRNIHGGQNYAAIGASEGPGGVLKTFEKVIVKISIGGVHKLKVRDLTNGGAVG